jgi:hypothetical protein
MAKTKISEWSTTPASNTDIDGINIAEGCAPSGINDAIRDLMAQVRSWQSGASGDPFNGPMNGTIGVITSTLATGTAPLTIASTTKVTNLNADLLDGADWASPAALGSTTPAAVSATTLSASSTVSGTGFSTYLASPPAIGGTTAAAGSFTTLSASSSVTLSGGTANGVTYLNGSKVLTSGSALTFDGTNLSNSQNTASPIGLVLTNTSASTSAGTQLTFKYGGSTTGYILNQFDGGDFNNQYMAAQNHIWLRGASEQMRLTSTGLGIGTSSPYKKLEVVGSGIAVGTNASASNLGIEILGTQNSLPAAQIRGYIATGDSGIGVAGDLLIAPRTDVGTSIRFITGTTPTERMRLDSSGNLGLGVTPSAWSAITAMQVKGAALGSTGNEMYLYANAYYASGTAWTYKNSAAAFGYEQNGGHKWFTAASGTAGNAITFTQAMTLDASGNLGVGTTSPSYKLDVNGAARSDSWLGRSNTSAPTADAFIYRPADNTLGFGTANTERARIDSSGNLLVGTTSTGLKTNRSMGFLVTGGCTQYISHSTTDASGDSYIEFGYNGTKIGSITQNGTTAVAYNTSSDYRLKNTIAPMTGALAKVALLKPCTYKWNADGSDGEGFIAHELAEVCPHAVTGEKDAVDAEGNPKYQGIDTSFLVATLTAAIQELKAEFDAYKSTHP